MKPAIQSFPLYESFTSQLFDIAKFGKPQRYRHDLVTIEETIHRIAVHAYSKQVSADVKALAVAFLKSTDSICHDCLKLVNEHADAIATRFAADPFVGPLPEAVATQCALRWDDERVWVLVRALVRIDTAHRQARRLRERGGIDYGQFRQLRESVVHPFRAASANIFKAAADLPPDVKGRLASPSVEQPV